MERPGWLRRIGMYIDALRAGEPIIWAGTIVFLVFAAVMLAVWWKTARDLRREDEELKRRRGGR
jgi:hypothetical protein